MEQILHESQKKNVYRMRPKSLKLPRICPNIEWQSSSHHRLNARSVQQTLAEEFSFFFCCSATLGSFLWPPKEYDYEEEEEEVKTCCYVKCALMPSFQTYTRIIFGTQIANSTFE